LGCSFQLGLLGICGVAQAIGKTGVLGPIHLNLDTLNVRQASGQKGRWFQIGARRAIFQGMEETKVEKLARLSGKATSKVLDALGKRGFDIRGKLSTPISRVPRRVSAKNARLKGDPTSIYNWRRLDNRITTSGQPTEPQLADIHALGVRHIINLGLHFAERGGKCQPSRHDVYPHPGRFSEPH
jgi:hypothetical protein